MKHIEKEILENKKSPEAIVVKLKENGFEVELCGKTIRNAVRKGNVFENIKPEK